MSGFRAVQRAWAFGIPTAQAPGASLSVVSCRLSALFRLDDKAQTTDN
jgi:hypothetical protein